MFDKNSHTPHLRGFPCRGGGVWGGHSTEDIVPPPPKLFLRATHKFSLNSLIFIEDIHFRASLGITKANS